ncbi:MAG: UDP-3-O-(3-hydroxymyristoyl)glucosamine N-acyltransferase [Alphaproteobacteria bacterium]|nr:UDP-3-O-(3-hydroxymyristoyl)glucosamine N-acyltransferase [Alphaproteobacteria bacterium]
MDHPFFSIKQHFSLGEICSTLGICPSQPQTTTFHGVAPLHSAGPNHISFFHNGKYSDALVNTKAGAVLVHPDFVHLVPQHCVALSSPSPYRDFAKVLNLFYPLPKSNGVISPLADIHPTAVIGRNVQIDAFVVIGPHAHIGDDTIVRAHCTIGDHVQVGKNCLLESHVSVSHCIMGDHAYIKPGARIGQSGFGFHMDENGHFDVLQLGCVRIGYDVQIGANTTIDRGSQSDTVIGNHVRIDNQVQIAHNVVIGDSCVIVSQVGIAGSTTLGKYVIVAGQAGIAGHLKIGNQVKIAGGSGIMRNIDDHETVAGSPAVDVKQWHRQTVTLKKLSQKTKDTR